MYTGITQNELIDALLIGTWAFLFTGPLSQPGQIFGALKGFLYQKVGEHEWLFNPLVGCAKCHAGQLSLWLPLILAGGVNLRLVIVSTFTAFIFEKWLNR